MLEFAETRPIEGSGICFNASTLKSQLRGFVTFDDMRSAAEQNPALVANARAFQQAFALGVARGIAEDADESAVGQPSLDVKPPPHLQEYQELWKWGQGMGFSYGKQLLMGSPGSAKRTKGVDGTGEAEQPEPHPHDR